MRISRYIAGLLVSAASMVGFAGTNSPDEKPATRTAASKPAESKLINVIDSCYSSRIIADGVTDLGDIAIGHDNRVYYVSGNLEKAAVYELENGKQKQVFKITAPTEKSTGILWTRSRIGVSSGKKGRELTVLQIGRDTLDEDKEKWTYFHGDRINLDSGETTRGKEFGIRKEMEGFKTTDVNPENGDFYFSAASSIFRLKPATLDLESLRYVEPPEGIVAGPFFGFCFGANNRSYEIWNRCAVGALGNGETKKMEFKPSITDSFKVSDDDPIRYFFSLDNARVDTSGDKLIAVGYMSYTGGKNIGGAGRERWGTYVLGIDLKTGSVSKIARSGGGADFLAGDKSYKPEFDYHIRSSAVGSDGKIYLGMSTGGFSKREGKIVCLEKK